MIDNSKTILKNGGSTMEEIKKKIKIIGPKVIDVGYRLHILEEAERIISRT